MYDVKKIRAAFPVFTTSKTIYLDNAATTYKPQVVIDAVTTYLVNETSNSGRGDYHDAYLVDQKVLETRKLLQSFLSAKSSDEIIFTQGTTMSINLIAHSFAAKMLQKGDEILLSVAEHASNTLPWFEVAKQTGAVVKFMPLSEKGLITSNIVGKYITTKTKIVAIAHVSNVLGFVNDVKSISKIVHEHGAILVVDGAQSVPHLPVNVVDLDIDFLAFSGHKMLAPTGIGVLYGKEELLKRMTPFMQGGGMNASYDRHGNVEYFKIPLVFEAGTLNLEAIYGLNAAIKFLNQIGLENIANHERVLREYAISKLKEMPHVELYNETADTGIITFNIKGAFSQDIATYYNSKNIAVRSGQHCAKLLKGHLQEVGTIRVSIYLYTTKEEIDTFLKVTETAEDYLDAYFE